MTKKIKLAIKFPEEMREEAIREFASLSARYREGGGIKKGMQIILG